MPDQGNLGHREKCGGMAGEMGGGGGRCKAREAKSSAAGLKELRAGWEGQRDSWVDANQPSLSSKGRPGEEPLWALVGPGARLF